MCIAIYKPVGGKITDLELENCWDNNPHGGGIAYPCNGDVKIQKAMDWKAFLPMYHKALNGEAKGKPMLVHFRISTSGEIDLLNCHPHRVSKKMAFIHNGIFSSPPKGSKISDTLLFNYQILQELPSNFMGNKAIMDLLEEYSGYSKLVFLDSNGNHQIVNEKLGDWHNGSWFSTTDYKYNGWLTLRDQFTGGKGEFDYDEIGTEGYMHDTRQYYGELDYCLDCGTVLIGDREKERSRESEYIADGR